MYPPASTGKILLQRTGSVPSRRDEPKNKTAHPNGVPQIQGPRNTPNTVHDKFLTSNPSAFAFLPYSEPP